MPYEISSAVLAHARSEFVRALDAAVPAYELGQLGFFSEATEGYIKKEVERKLYEPALPNAGDRERKWVERLEKLAGMRDWDGSGRAFHAAARIKQLLPKEPWNPGQYYTRTPLTPRSGKEQFDWLLAMRDLAASNKAWDRKFFCDLLLGGLPEPVSNFRIECLYLLKMPDGQIERRVRLVNTLGEASGEINLDSKAFASPEKFRDWCLSKGNFAWKGNQTALQDLHQDICAEAAWKVINCVMTLGWLQLSPEEKDGVMDGVWFAGDCAYRNGVRLELENGCYSIAKKIKNDNGEEEVSGEGYKVMDTGLENKFHQKQPKLKPDRRITEFELAFNEANDLDALPKKPDEHELTARFFRELCCRLKRLCGESANLIIGSMLGYAAAPEIFERMSMFPGVLLHGVAGSGKSTILEWLMDIYGFTLHQGVLLRTGSTAVGLSQTLDQYSCLPVWLDEFREGKVAEDKLSVIHNSYNRGSQPKFSLTKVAREPKTSFVISGESTPSDAALRGRFPLVQIAKSMRQGTAVEQKEDFKWFLAHRQYFFVFGRYLLENRSKFVQLVMKHMDSWMTEDIDPRAKTSNGVSYSAWMAMVELLSQHFSVMSAAEVKTFKAFMLEHTLASAVDVASETNINVFWTDLLPAVMDDAIPAECFRLEWDGMEHPPGATNRVEGGAGFTQGRWKSYRLYIEPDSLLAQLQIFLSKQRTNVVLRRKDLRDQLSKEDYWIQLPQGKKIRKRFTTGTAGGVPCWGIEVDKHPLGYVPVSDAEYDQYIVNVGDGDPRKGPLFDLVDWVLRAREEEEPKG